MGVFTLPTYPSDYVTMAECAYTLYANGNRVALAFADFQTEGGYDILYLHDGPNIHSPLIHACDGTHCANTNFTSNSAYITALWYSDANNVFPGWNSTFSSGGPVSA